MKDVKKTLLVISKVLSKVFGAMLIAHIKSFPKYIQVFPTQITIRCLLICITALITQEEFKNLTRKR